MKHKTRYDKHKYDHYVYAYALDLGHTYYFKTKWEHNDISPY